MGLFTYTPPVKPDQVVLHNPDQLDGCHFDDIMQKTVSRCPGCGSYGERHKCEYCGTVLNASLQDKKYDADYSPFNPHSSLGVVPYESQRQVYFTQEGDEIISTIIDGSDTPIVTKNGYLLNSEELDSYERMCRIVHDGHMQYRRTNSGGAR